MSNELIRELVEAVEAARKAHESLFTQCLTNGVFTQWGQPVDCTALNEAGRLASYALIAKARAYLESDGWTRVGETYTMQAIAPHSSVITHARLDRSLPPGTELFARIATPEPPKG